jgi:DNA-binding response OmpR family regulator
LALPFSQFAGSLASRGYDGDFTTSSAADVVNVLCVSPFDDDHQKLSYIFSQSKWQLAHAFSCDEAVQSVKSQPFPVLICEKDLAGQCWRSMLRRLRFLALKPEPRLVVSARLADDQLWSEVLNLGGYNVLEKPFDKHEVFWVVSHAWLDWKSERDRTLTPERETLTRSATV